MKTKLLFASALIALGFGAKAQWIPQFSGFGTDARGINGMDILDTNTVWAVGYDGGGGTANTREFTTTVDGGNTWTAGSITGAPSNLELSTISAVSATKAWAVLYPPTATATGQGIYYTNDGGATWTKQSAGYTSASFVNIVHFWDANNGVTMGDPVSGYFEIYTTTDGGTTWTRTPQANIAAPVSGEYGYVDNFSVVGGTIWFGTNKGRVYKSTDKGLNWTAAAVDASFTDCQKVAFKDANIGLVRQNVITSNMLTEVKLFRTTDGGATWSAVAPVGRFYASDVCHVPNTVSTWISTGAYGPTNSSVEQSGSSFSLDNGDTWTTIDSVDQHTAVSFINPYFGWTGGFVNGGAGGIFRWDVAAGIPLSNKKIENVNLSTVVSVYPNPSNGRFSVQMSNLSGRKVTTEVYNMVGERISQSALNMSSNLYINQIDLSGQAAGVYFVKINDGTNTITKKLIKE